MSGPYSIKMIKHGLDTVFSSVVGPTPPSGFDRVFGNNTPAQISAVSAEISANGYTSAQVEEIYGWKIGDTITIPRSTGDTIEVRISGYNHYPLSDGSGTAGILLEMTHCLPELKPISIYYGYPDSDIHTTYLPSVKSTFPIEWQNIIKTTIHTNYYNKASRYNYNAELFIPLEYELYGSVYYGYASYLTGGTLYEWYKINKAGTNRIKSYDANGDGVLDTTCRYWTSSNATSGGMVVVTDVGGVAGTSDFSTARGVSFAFCV